MQPCEQSDNIKNISKTLDSIEKAIAQQTQLLRDVAVQNVRIEHLEKHGEASEGHFTELFNRMRAVEAKAEAVVSDVKLEISGTMTAVKLDIAETMTEAKLDISEAMKETDRKLERIMLFIDYLSGKPAMWVAVVVLGMVAVGTICDLAYHFPLIQKVWGAIKS